MSTQISGDTGVSQCQPGSVSQDDLQVGAKGIGIGQTWQNMTASRVNGQQYQNLTGQPIKVSLYSTSALSTTGSATILVGALNVSYNYMPGISGTSTVTNARAEVPAGAYYTASWVGTGTVMELRA